MKEYEITAPAISTAGVYFFTTDSGIIYEVRFGRRQDNILHVTIVFGVINDEYEGEEYSVTNKGELYSVMWTLVKVVKIFMEEHPKVTCYEFTGLAKEDEKENKASARLNLYNRYFPKVFEDDKWDIQTKGYNTVLVTRRKV